MRIRTTPSQKPVNLLGESFKIAKKSSKMRFKASLLEAGEITETDYWRRFSQHWQYTEQLNDIPLVIVVNAVEHLGYKHPLLEKLNQVKG